MSEPAFELGDSELAVSLRHLRQRAEAVAGEASHGEAEALLPARAAADAADDAADDAVADTVVDADAARHELRVHQIELEMQNEQLRGTQVDLDAERARYFDLYDLAPVGYCTMSSAGVIEEANLAVAALLGLPRRELVGLPFTRFLHSEDQDHYYLSLKRLAMTEAPRVLELRMVGDGGDSTWVRLQIVVPTMQGVSGGYWLVINDITEQKQLEHDRDRSLRQLENLKMQLEVENRFLSHKSHAQAGNQIVAESAVMKACLHNIELVAVTGATVLLTGETGVGKELAARMIHDRSQRDGPFVTVNCAALPANLIESELFGHERGAFTGAVARKPGRLEMANRGTLFLDEIGELPLVLQAKLLRVLQEREYERVGGVQTIAFGGRVVAATNRNLELAVAEDRFRSDLFYRLNVFPIVMPSLRERPADLALLVGQLTAKLAATTARKIESVSPRFLDHVRSCDWPGNVRELENFIQRALIVGSGSELDLDSSNPVRPAVSATGSANLGVRMRKFEREHLVEVLQQSQWVIEGEQGAAARLEIAASTLRSKMLKLDIRRDA
ncbi:MAG: formate hydrogenlyase transcriptional activator [Hyphomicrobiaceae bacterium]|jgi:formate hydrogenlyase transcriptional activator